MAGNYVRRGEWYHYNRRVPKKLEAYDKRKHIRIALKTKDEKEAQKSAAIFDDFIEKYWRDLIQSGRTDEDRVLFEKVRSVAKAHGFAYKNMAEILNSSLTEVLSRIEVVDLQPKVTQKALLGGEVLSEVRLQDCLQRFWPLCEDRLTKKSAHQIRKYQNPRNAAMKSFISIVGNIFIVELERTQVLKFRNWFMERIGKGVITGDTANKQMRHVKDMLETVARDAEIEMDFKALFADMKLKKDVKSRSPFEAGFVQKAFLNQPTLKGLNHDARILVYLMIETGARESELIGLDVGNDVFLNEDVPYLWIRENSIRTLKNSHSERKVPLVGVSLMAAKQLVINGGLARYHKNPDSASSLINKYFRNHGLKPTPQHSLYSLRHTFKDRLRDVDAPEEIIAELMGHRKGGPTYGRGRKLEQKYEWLQRIAFESPKDL